MGCARSGARIWTEQGGDIRILLRQSERARRVVQHAIAVFVSLTKEALSRGDCPQRANRGALVAALAGLDQVRNRDRSDDCDDRNYDRQLDERETAR